MENEKIKRRKRRNDIILISSLFVLIVLSLVLFFAFSNAGNTVSVYVDGELYGSYPLSQNKEIEISNGKGGENVLVIKDKSVYMKSASCPHASDRCVGEYPKTLKGQSIYCIPNGIRVSIE